MRDGKTVGPVTAAIRAMQESCEEADEPKFINSAGDVIGWFSIGVKRFSRPTAKRRTVVPIGVIEVGQYGCRASLCRAGNGRDLGTFRTAAEAESAILARSPIQPHPVNWQNSAFTAAH